MKYFIGNNLQSWQNSCFKSTGLSASFRSERRAAACKAECLNTGAQSTVREVWIRISLRTLGGRERGRLLFKAWKMYRVRVEGSSFLILCTHRYASSISVYIFLSCFSLKDSIENEYLVSVLDSDTPRAIGLEKSGSWDSNFISKSSKEQMNFSINFP